MNRIYQTLLYNIIYSKFSRNEREEKYQYAPTTSESVWTSKKFSCIVSWNNIIDEIDIIYIWKNIGKLLKESMKKKTKGKGI